MEPLPGRDVVVTERGEPVSHTSLAGWLMGKRIRYASQKFDVVDARAEWVLLRGLNGLEEWRNLACMDRIQVLGDAKGDASE